MKIVKSIDYEKLRITAENGWSMLYNWQKTKKIMKICNYIIMAITIFLAFLFRNQITSNLNNIISVFNSQITPKLFYFLVIVILVCVYILVIVPLHELLHLFVFSPNIFSSRSYIVINSRAVSAHYDGIITKKKEIISLLFPVVVLSVLLIALSLCNFGQLGFCFFFLFYMNLAGSYSDIMMAILILKKYHSKIIIYGNRYQNTKD